MAESLSRFPVQNEQIHKQLDKLHWDIVSVAQKRIASALTTLHKLEVEHDDVRERCRAYIGDLEKLRLSLDVACREADNIRNKIIYENGCEGTCSES